MRQHRAHCVGHGVAEAQPELICQEAELIATAKRAAGRKGDQQGFRPRGVAGRGLRLEVEPGDALFRRGDALVEPPLLLFHALDRLRRLARGFAHGRAGARARARARGNRRRGAD